MKQKFVVSNWKMNPSTPREAKLLASILKKLSVKTKRAKIIACPPSVFLPLVVPLRPLKRIAFGGQDLSFQMDGAHTGEISAEMLKYSGAEYCIIGHSERRRAGETDKMIRLKVEAAARAGLTPILCIGEEKRDKEGEYLEVLRRQIHLSLGDLKKSYSDRLVIAYEPVWAIGKDAHGADTPEHFFHNALFIKKTFAGLASPEAAHALPVIYGGSVTPKNAEGFLNEGRADGLLVGRASLVPDQIKEIVRVAENSK